MIKEFSYSGIDKDKLFPIINETYETITSYGFSDYYYYNISSGKTYRHVDSRTRRWINIYRKNDYLLCDPVALRCFTSTEPFTWAEAIAGIKLTRRQQELFQHTKDFGITAGFCIPIPLSALDFAVFGILGKAGPQFDAILQSKREILESLGHQFHQAIKQHSENTRKIAPPPLTERERECLLWAARGKTNEEIGIILSISDSTVKAHLSGVAKKLNTHTKTQTVVEAIKRGMLAPW
ncbi:autoinducer-binding protein [Iodidimonas gelatinilytica]|uniref:Autoinducer-binding protein n=1 Tax=Iodidimonas gelatinilytica TaxID=1236966 RepID=A0A5A7MY08_9PROT|nr:autoinducer binding domain-containing protein [Iodidimonas gelatinilytica]GEQ97982.1 autoinducer-binding protein [Iodidimonas gelatinilytica]GEQ99899.1 autoinducer-binding protein [Iodidimonas gelatinilytica]